MTYRQYRNIGETLRNRRPDQGVDYYYDCTQDIFGAQRDWYIQINCNGDVDRECTFKR